MKIPENYPATLRFESSIARRPGPEARTGSPVVPDSQSFSLSNLSALNTAGMAQREPFLDALTASIQSGAYAADWNATAENMLTHAFESNGKQV
ncbi:MAG: hypothetical protein H7039_01035 [Bryobacteraceae bacterium]|nr:hypothetical protein [Bryobacteraceae bacterium]